MREILFKGKKKDNGEWIEGYLQSQREWLFTLLGGKMEDSYVQQMSEMRKETDGSGKH